MNISTASGVISFNWFFLIPWEQAAGTQTLKRTEYKRQLIAEC
jgi:hypothetical protein